MYPAIVTPSLGGKYVQPREQDSGASLSTRHEKQKSRSSSDNILDRSIRFDMTCTVCLGSYCKIHLTFIVDRSRPAS
jgi:hypothetical protein